MTFLDLDEEMAEHLSRGCAVGESNAIIYVPVKSNQYRVFSSWGYFRFRRILERVLVLPKLETQEQTQNQSTFEGGLPKHL